MGDEGAVAQIMRPGDAAIRADAVDLDKMPAACPVQMIHGRVRTGFKAGINSRNRAGDARVVVRHQQQHGQPGVDQLLNIAFPKNGRGNDRRVRLPGEDTRDKIIVVPHGEQGNQISFFVGDGVHGARHTAEIFVFNTIDDE